MQNVVEEKTNDSHKRQIVVNNYKLINYNFFLGVKGLSCNNIMPCLELCPVYNEHGIM